MFKLIRNVKLSTRIAMIVAAFTTCTAITLIYVISQVTNKDMLFTQQELLGVAFQRPLYHLLDVLPNYQADLDSTDAAAQAAAPAASQAIDDAFSALDDANKAYGQGLMFDDQTLAAKGRSTAAPAHLLQEWQSIKAMPSSAKPRGPRRGIRAAHE